MTEAAPAILPELRSLRDSIDNIDAAIIHMLAERFRCTQRVGQLKAEHHLPPADPSRCAGLSTRQLHGGRLPAPRKRGSRSRD